MYMSEDKLLYSCLLYTLLHYKHLFSLHIAYKLVYIISCHFLTLPSIKTIFIHEVLAIYIYLFIMLSAQKIPHINVE
jgi:hypothetical protein